MRQSILSLSLAPLALAADASLTMFYPDITPIGGVDAPTATSETSDLETPTLSIISAAAQTTVATLGCGPQTSATDCLFAGFTYTEISTTVYQYHYTADIGANIPLTIDVDCTSKKPAVTCTVNAPNADKLTVSGVNPSDMSSAFNTGTTTYTGDQVQFITAPVTAGQEKLQAATTASPSPSGTPQGSKSGSQPAQQTGKNAAGRFGVEKGAWVGVLGVAAVAQYL